MAGSSIADSQKILTGSKSPTSATDWARAILAPLASLKLTVFLLVLAVFVTFIITLEQATLDIWALKNKHFHNFFVYVPFATFVPLNWFPNRPDIPGGLIVPSGLTIIGAMLINLTAAHVLRFKIQASGGRLYLGIGILLMSALLTWVIVFNYQDAEGFGGQPPIAWTTMWKFLQIAVLGLGVASAYAVFTLSNKRIVERIIYSCFAVTLLVLLVLSVVLGESAFIGDSAMRIMWQLAQSTISALAVLFGCILIFKRKAGIVVLHLGIAGLLANELFVTITNEEHRVSVVEGATVHHASDLRETEFVVIDRSDDSVDRMTVIPGEILQDSEDQIDDDRLPFKVRCLEYMQNSDVVRVGPHAENKADSGIGTRYIAVAKKPASGADANAGVDQAAAYVELIDRKSNDSLGKYMVSQLAYAESLVDTVEVNEDKYQIGLRFKTVYPEYSIRLKDTSAKYYVGTETPKSFSSDFVIEDDANGINSDQKIWMNNPLRYRDQTFYQTTYVKDSDLELPGDQEMSGIQVVRNSGWMIPYVCCMFVVVGLVAQFQQTFVNSLGKSNGQDPGAVNDGDTTSSFSKWLPTVVLLGLFGIYYGGQLARSIAPKTTKAKGSEIRLDLLGQVPVTFDGRVQPLDSYARNLARQLSNRELVSDKHGTKQPAIRWFADMMFDASGANDYEILRIEDMNVQNALDLPKRKGLKYKFSEIRESNEKLIEQMNERAKIPRDERTPYHNRIAEVYGKTQLLIGTQVAFWGSEGRYNEDDALERLKVSEWLAGLAFDLEQQSPTMPFSIPTDSVEQPWMPLSVAIEHLWLKEIAQDAKTSTELANKILDQEIAAMRPEFVKKKIIAELMKYEEIVEGLASKFELQDPKELGDVLERNWHQIPPRLYEDEEKDAEKFVDSQLANWRFGKDQIIAELIADVGFTPGKLSFDPVIALNLIDLKKAYVDGDAKSFNKSLETHLAAMKDSSPFEYSQTKINTEIGYNYFSPFYVATCLYLFAFLTTIASWIAWRAPINRAAFWLIVFALVVHIGGVVARVVISGRPPITNLYSSFVVVAAGCVITLLIVEYVTKLGIGNLLGSISGFASLLYAWTLSINQGDTFTVLRAVLDTQFWLTTHVIIINLGYSATLAAGLVGVALLFNMLFLKTFNKNRRQQFTNLIYGKVCFALLFSFFGTVLGGLWADDSWGRFWGWDPKENGALMIVLWNAVILHARWAGLAKERGIAALAAFGNIIVIWSWEGVNQLGVGLHAYSDSAGGGSTQSVWVQPLFYLKLFVVMNLIIACMAIVLPKTWYRSYSVENQVKLGN